MKAVQLSGPGAVEVREIAPPLAGSDEALLEPLYVGVCGTDLELVDGTMPYLQDGRAAYPMQPGHEAVADVVECRRRPNLVGKRVVVDPVLGCQKCAACRAGMTTRCARRSEIGVSVGVPGAACEKLAVPVRNLHVVPDGVTSRAAVLAEPLVTVLNAIQRLRPRAGERALVVGAGTLGLMAAQVLLSREVAVEVASDVLQRLSLVEAIGAGSARIRGEYDIVLEAAGTAGAVARAVQGQRQGAAWLSAG